MTAHPSPDAPPDPYRTDKDSGIPEQRGMQLIRIEGAARRLTDRLALYRDSEGRDRVQWPVDRDGNSDPQDDALVYALIHELGASQ